MKLTRKRIDEKKHFLIVFFLIWEESRTNVLKFSGLTCLHASYGPTLELDKSLFKNKQAKKIKILFILKG